jgi:hypothetical protein
MFLFETNCRELEVIRECGLENLSDGASRALAFS